MKRLLITLIALVTISASAQFTTNGLYAAGRRAILSGPVELLSLQLYNTNASTAALIYVIDSGVETNRWNLPAYVSVSTPATWITNYFTNWYGGVMSNAFQIVSRSLTTNASSWPYYPTIYSVSVPAATTVTWTPAIPIQTLYGLNLSNASGIDFTATYSR